MPQTATVPAPPPRSKLKHEHGNGQTYLFTCEACREDDKARSAPDYKQFDGDDLERVTFLVPPDYDGEVCRAYLRQKYPRARYIVSSLNRDQLAGWQDGEVIVIVRRDCYPDEPRPATERAVDKEGKWVTQKVAPLTYVADVVECEALDVRKGLVYPRHTRFEKGKIDDLPLLTRMAEQMAPPYRLDLPKHKNDVVMYFIRA
jgi:hypothetical protein